MLLWTIWKTFNWILNMKILNISMIIMRIKTILREKSKKKNTILKRKALMCKGMNKM